MMEVSVYLSVSLSVCLSVCTLSDEDQVLIIHLYKGFPVPREFYFLWGSVVSCRVLFCFVHSFNLFFM